jgi:ribonuclease BN (tRNA processing enzyme)
VQLRVLGSSGTAPSATNPASGYLITSGSTRLLLDAGPGVAMALMQHMAPEELDGIFLSHRHPDHCADIFALFHHLAYVTEAPLPPLPVFAPPDLIAAAAAFVGASEAWDEVFSWRQASGIAAVGDLELRFGAADHSVPAACVAVHAADGAIAYSGDTGPGGELTQLAAGAGTLLCEATYQDDSDDDYPLHLSARQAGRIAHEAGVGRLIMTHLRSTLDPETSIEEAASQFAGKTLVAMPGMVIQL